MTIQSVERAVDILRAIAEKSGPLGLPELSEALNLPKTTIHTIVKTLSKKGFLRQDPASKKYGLGFALYELGAMQIGELEIQRMATPIIDRLANDIGKECRFGIWNDNSILITLEVHPVDYGRSARRQIGPRIPAYCSALGKAILAFMPDDEVTEYLKNTEMVSYTAATVIDKDKIRSHLLEIREQGYSYSNGELISYRTAIGVPVFGADEKPKGAISASIDPLQTGDSPAEMGLIINKLLRAAHELSLDLGFPAIRTMK